jgi:hypothetical protein
MRSLVLVFSICSLGVLASGTAFAQGDPRFHEFGRGTLERVHADLERAEADLRYMPEEELRAFRRTRAGLHEFHRDWENGRYDRRALDSAIEGLERLVRHDRLRPRDREFLAGDLRSLREMRERIERGRDRR